jgi:hypothetical protein
LEKSNLEESFQFWRDHCIQQNFKFRRAKIEQKDGYNASSVFTLYKLVTINAASGVPNQALKLRIITARVFAARQFAATKLYFGTSAHRTTWRHLFAAVSLAPVR